MRIIPNNLKKMSIKIIKFIILEINILHWIINATQMHPNPVTGCVLTHTHLITTGYYCNWLPRMPTTSQPRITSRLKRKYIINKLVLQYLVAMNKSEKQITRDFLNVDILNRTIFLSDVQQANQLSSEEMSVVISVVSCL